MRRHVLGAVAQALAEHARGDQACDAAVDVDHRAAGEVEGAERPDPAAGTPHPVRDRRVDDDPPEPREPEHRRKPHPVGEGAADQRRGDDREGHLERHEDALGDRAGQRVDAHAAQEQALQAAEIGPLAAERQAVAERHPDQGREAAGGEDLHAHREHVLLAHHAAVEHREAGDGHHQDQRGRGQHPGGVAGIQHRLLRPGARGRKERRRTADQAESAAAPGAAPPPHPVRNRCLKHRHPFLPLETPAAGMAARGRTGPPPRSLVFNFRASAPIRDRRARKAGRLLIDVGNRGARLPPS